MVTLKLREHGGWLELSFGDRQQTSSLVSSPRHFGGLQWYVVCPKSKRKVRVLFRPLGATFFASRHAWGRSAAYASQFLHPIGGPGGRRRRSKHGSLEMKARTNGICRQSLKG